MKPGLPRRWFDFVILILALLGTAQAANGKPPNVVLVIIDDLGWADLGCYGSRYHRTTFLDLLAREGMRFTQAYAACPVCSPTRAALMTGKYPARLHLTDYHPGQPNRPNRRLLRPDFRQELPLEEFTMAELFKQAGYATAAIGKWHLGGKGFEATRQGFDFKLAGDAVGSPASYFAPFRTREGRVMPGLENAPDGEYLTDRLGQEAEKFIEANKDRPFFLYLPHFAVHTPLGAKPEMVATYDKSPKKPGQQQNPVYAAMVESMDQSVTRVMRKLEALNLEDDTIVIFTSDNGGLATLEGPGTPSTSNAPLREGKGYLYEGGIRVPLLIRWHGRVDPGTTSNIVTSTIDLLPTVAELCGLKLPGPVDGVSIAPVLLRTGELKPRPVYWHYPHYSPQGGKPGGAIRDGDFKLIEFYEQGRRELFNVTKDISETTNLIDQESDRAERMATRLASWLKEVKAQMPAPNPDFVPDTQAEDGTITLPGATAEVHGVMLRYEPLPHKRTLGFWTRSDDWLSWDFQVNKPGEFELEILQGCGAGSGGSQVDFSVGDQKVTATVQETGGFQDFVARRVGTLRFPKPGRFTLTVKPRSKPGPAVMDLREVRLIPATGK